MFRDHPLNKIKKGNKKSAFQAPLVPGVDGAFSDVAGFGEMGGDLGGDLDIGHAVDAGEDEGLQFRIAVDPRGGARAARAPVLGDGGVAGGQVFKSDS